MFNFKKIDGGRNNIIPSNKIPRIPVSTILTFNNM